MDNDVSVARLSDDEDWNDRTPPGPGSRLRVLAVMGAVVVGCGVAAVAVGLTPDDGEDRADDGDTIVIVEPSDTARYPTTGGVAPTSTGTVSSEVTLPDDGSTAPDSQEGNLGGGGSPDESGDDAAEPGQGDDAGGGDNRGNGGGNGNGDGEDNGGGRGDGGGRDDKPGDSTPPSTSGKPSHTKTSSSAPTSTTPPGDGGGGDDDDDDCPWWQPRCW